MNKYAVIGKGFIYPRHKQAIEATGGKIIMTCDNRFNETQPDFADWLVMFRHPRFAEVDTVVICTPNYLHGPMIREARRRGKKVICEKPLALEHELIDDDTDVYPVLQLRYHPELKNLKATNVKITAKMFRDEKYWNSWKGDVLKSGGILYNLGIHYIDLLVYLLGEPIEILNALESPKMASGRIQFAKGIGEYHIEILDTREGQNRELIVDGRYINLSDKDNLSYEDLHKEVYKHFIKGEGVSLGEARKSLQLVDDLLNFKWK